MARVVVLGGSVAGLAASVGMARRGHEVVVVERDPLPELTSGEEAFQSWERKGVPQFRQAHAFSARSRNLLREHIPEVLDQMRADGIEEFNVFKAIAPPELWEEGDDDFTGLLTRRPGFELALRSVAEREPNVTILSPAAVTGLRCDRADDGTLHVMGVDIDDGHIDADVVLDCGGRRSPVPAWLADHDVLLPTEQQDCGASYYTRYFRLRPDAGLPQMLLFALRGETAEMMYIGFPGDHDSFGITFMVRPDDEAYRSLRHTPVWEAAAQSIEPMRGWLDPEKVDPITDVLVMASHRNVRRQFVMDDRPLVLGLLLVGDALCTTNPTYGWGASMALTYAFSAVDAINDHEGDAIAMACAYDKGVRDEADAVYRESAAMDRMRAYRLTGAPIPDDDAAEMERQSIILEGVFAGAFRDPVLGRATLRRTNLLDSPAAVLDAPDVRERAIAARDAMAEKRARTVGPTRDEMVALLAAANPVS